MRIFIKGLGAFALLTAILLGGVEVVAFLARRIGQQIFHGVNPTVSAAAVAAMSTVVVAVATLVIGRHYERRAAVEAEIRSSKIPIYSRLVESLLRMLLRGDAATAGADRFAEELREITPQLIAWASDDVLIEWSRFKRSISVASTEAETEAALFELEKLLIAIRRDYGHKGQTVKEGDLLGLFINDAHELLQRRRNRIRQSSPA
ncbi:MULTISPECIES: hypothetical protein [unclassified Streptomyces]|uniref:hypothetical protein n=1 Tax=unclassified Streptomyces TaxID=2593676 RepID=UPI00087F6383|nr:MULTISPECIES: hypothetical protein [unclassified Streptomyces]PBC85738.1 hypothetical protein BX261_5762 [Streptomyces sp. 2321.6]SDR07272.1 hypothetical protein SAMN05216511_1501 [Streptomyces sp. KS_16]SED77615.1 hypothetical protein SAMN05428940_5788 [Streptomyces sp. 2133.1]